MGSVATPLRMSIFDFLDESNRQLIIPVYQRNYSWNANNQVIRLLEDIKNIATGKFKNHFTGIFMTVEAPDSVSKFHKTYLVDGQQRLTTLFLILWALKELYPKDDNIGRVDELLYNSDFIKKNFGQKYGLKLKPAIGDDDVYQIIASGLDDSEKDVNGNKKPAKGIDRTKLTEKQKESKVYKNYDYILKFFKQHRELDIDGVIDALNEMDIVEIPLLDDDDPQQIFESINALGLPLTPIDLIRNLVLMRLNDTEQEEIYENHWKLIENVFDSEHKEKLEEVFRLYVAINNFDLVKSDDLYIEFSTIWNKRVSCYDERINMLDEIKDYVEYYNELYFKKDFYPISDSKFKQILIDFRAIGSSTIAPFMLEVYFLYKNNKIDDESLSNILALMNTYIIRRECAGFPLNDASRFFPQLLRSVKRACKDDYKDVYQNTIFYLVNMNRNNSLGIPTDERIKNYLSTNNAYTMAHKLLILTRLENKNNSTPIVDRTELSVEHVMPQTQDDPGYWKKAIGSEIDNYDIHCNKIGNLTIVSCRDNSAMRNHSFDKKKEFLKQSKHIKLNNDILYEIVIDPNGNEIEQERSKWDVTAINKRTDKLIAAINTEYKYIIATVDKKLAYDIQLNKVNSKGSFQANAKIYNGGDIIVQDDCVVMYKLGSAYMSKTNIVNALSKGFLVENPDKTITLKKDSKFDSLDVVTEVFMGDLPKNYFSVWCVLKEDKSTDDIITIDNVLSVLAK